MTGGKARVLAAAAGLAVALLACQRTEENPALTGSPPARTVTVQMNAQNNSGQTGTAVLTATPDGRTRIVLDLTSAPGDPQPAHIHSGTCPNLDPRPQYGLTNVQNGRSETTVDARLEDLLAGQFVVNVHKSAAEPAVYYSCGEVAAG